MDVEIYGRLAGKVKKLHFKKSSDSTTLVTLSWEDRNACNDGTETYTESVNVDTEELHKLKDIL